MRPNTAWWKSPTIASAATGLGAWVVLVAITTAPQPWSDPWFWPIMLSLAFTLGGITEARPRWIGAALVATGPLVAAVRILMALGEPRLLPTAVLMLVAFGAVLSVVARAGRLLRRRLRGTETEPEADRTWTLRALPGRPATAR
jgi:hypothetical protein